MVALDVQCSVDVLNVDVQFVGDVEVAVAVAVGGGGVLYYDNNKNS